MLPNILLFDVDGTLVDTGGAGRRAIEAAFRDSCGGEVALSFSFAGMTDKAIVRSGLRGLDQADGGDEVDRLLERYLLHLASEVQSSDTYVVHPGVEVLLDRARGRGSRYAVGLGTGNIRRGAQIKLARGGLAEGFSFGGFGCDHEDRAELLRVGAHRGAEQLGVPLETCRVVVVGDTPRDIAAASAVGAECVAVATGPFGVEELRRCGPTAVFETLADDQALGAVLGDA